MWSKHKTHSLWLESEMGCEKGAHRCDEERKTETETDNMRVCVRVYLYVCKRLMEAIEFQNKRKKFLEPHQN